MKKLLFMIVTGLLLPTYLHATTGFSLLVPLILLAVGIGFLIAFFKVLMFFWNTFFGAIGFFRFFGMSRRTSFLLIALLAGVIYIIYGEKISELVKFYVQYIVIQYLP